MRMGRTLINSVATLVLPRATAAAACSESFVEKRCVCNLCAATCTRGGMQSRVCQYCNGVKRCAGWLCSAGTCAKTFNPC